MFFYYLSVVFHRAVLIHNLIALVSRGLVDVVHRVWGGRRAASREWWLSQSERLPVVICALPYVRTTLNFKDHDCPLSLPILYPIALQTLNGANEPLSSSNSKKCVISFKEEDVWLVVCGRFQLSAPCRYTPALKTVTSNLALAFPPCNASVITKPHSRPRVL